MIFNLKLPSLALGVITALLTALPLNAAERISFYYGPLGFSVSVNALEVFALEGKVDKELAFYLNRLTPKQQAQFRDFLRQSYNVNHVSLYRFANTSVGERLLANMGRIIQIEGGINSFQAIRGALVQAAAEPEGLSFINFLRKFPTNIELNTAEALKLNKQLSRLVKQTGKLVASLEEQMREATATDPSFDFATLPDLRSPGNFSSAKQIMDLRDPARDRNFTLHLYLPQASNLAQIPVIVISNGLAAKPSRFDKLAKHLASHGFAVAIPDHPGSNAQRQKYFYLGLYKENFDATEFIDRPLDVTYLLNHLEQRNKIEFQGKLNLQQVGIFGYSFGGTTALALAGADMNFEQLEKDCGSEMNVLNISLLYQCRALELPRKTYQLEDSRIKAAFLFVPFGNSMFGEASIKNINIPIFWQATDVDIITPLLLEQIPSFSGLTTPDKYLVVSRGLSHSRVTFNFVKRITNRDISWTDLKNITLTYQSALSVAFFKVHITQDDEYSRYLQANYIQALSEEPYNLSLVKFLETAEK